MAGVLLESSTSRIRNGAWLTYAVILSTMLTAGTIYGFGEWSALLKQPDGYALNQVQVEFLALCGHFGNYMVLDSGFLISRFGTVFGMALGSSYACLGYVGVWLSLTSFNGQVPIWMLAMLCVLYGHGCGTIDNAAMSELMADFPLYKGYAVGTVKAYYGLATATVVTIFKAAFPGDPANFLLFLAFYSGLAGLSLTPIMYLTKGLVDEPSHVVRTKFKLVAFTIAAFAVLFCVVQSNATMMTQGAWEIVLVVVAFGGVSPFMLSLRCGVEQEDNVKMNCAQFPHADNLSVTETLRTLNFYIFICVLTICQGAGLLMIGNASQVLSAMQSERVNPTAFVALISVANSLGRLFAGLLSESCVGKIDRPVFLSFAAGILCLSYAVLFWNGSACLWPAAAGVGFGYGSLWGVQPALAQELFGPKDFGVKYSFTALAALAGSLVFSTLLAGELYDMEQKRLGTADGCFHPSCFETAFGITGMLAALAVVLSWWLSVRTAPLYKSFYLQGCSDSWTDEDSESQESDSKGSNDS